MCERRIAPAGQPPHPSSAGMPGLVRGGRRVVSAGFTWREREAGSTQPATAARRAALALDLVARLLVLVVLVVEGELLVRLDPPDREECDPRQRWGRVVHPDRVRPQVRLAAVVEEARDAARVVGVDRVLVVCPRHVEVEEGREALRVVDDAAPLRLLGCDDLARVLAHEPALLDRLERTDSPPLVQRLEDLQPHAHPALHDAVPAADPASASRVALVQQRVRRGPQSTARPIRKARAAVPHGGALLARAQAAAGIALARTSREKLGLRLDLHRAAAAVRAADARVQVRDARQRLRVELVDGGDRHAVVARPRPPAGDLVRDVVDLKEDARLAARLAVSWLAPTAAARPGAAGLADVAG
mmetsp:Transcript_9343/g.29554  ORF Transcript_9343/g.29554 Transcript_9343/m.29554 type:complete len:359 (+) Transcript_9343:177-1253(+)